MGPRAPRGAVIRKLLGAHDVGVEELWGEVECRRVTGQVVLESLKDGAAIPTTSPCTS